MRSVPHYLLMLIFIQIELCNSNRCVIVYTQRTNVNEQAEFPIRVVTDYLPGRPPTDNIRVARGYRGR